VKLRHAERFYITGRILPGFQISRWVRVLAGIAL
jgi:hypothetical protein